MTGLWVKAYASACGAARIQITFMSHLHHPATGPFVSKNWEKWQKSAIFSQFPLLRAPFLLRGRQIDCLFEL